VHTHRHTHVHTHAHVLAVRAVKSLGWKDPFTLVGHSLGAGVGSIMAAVSSHTIRTLVCIDHLGVMTKPADSALGVCMYVFRLCVCVCVRMRVCVCDCVCANA